MRLYGFGGQVYEVKDLHKADLVQLWMTDIATRIIDCMFRKL